MSETWLSILIPVYNVADYLDDCLESVLSQSGEGVEIVVLDDCSTDSSARLLAEFQARNIPGLKILRHDVNRGLSAARNTLLEDAQGEYIWFLDSDDFLLPGAVDELRAILTECRPDCVMFNFTTVPEEATVATPACDKGRRVTTFPSPSGELLTDAELLFSGMFRKRRFHAWARVVKKTVWDHGVRFPVGKKFEDIYTTPRLALSMRSYWHQASTWVAYRSRQTSIVQTPTLEKVRDLAQAPYGLLDEWLEYGVTLSRRSRFDYYNFCAINFINAVKMLSKAGIGTVEIRDEIRDNLYANCGFGGFQLTMLFLKNARLPMLLRMLRYLYGRRCLRPRSTQGEKT